MLYILQFENEVKKLLQRDVKFSIGDSVIKSGKILNFRIKEPYVFFTILNHKNKIVEIYYPIPFAYDFSHENDILFDYRISNITFGSNEIKKCLATSFKKSNNYSKLYDKILKISS